MAERTSFWEVAESTSFWRVSGEFHELEARGACTFYTVQYTVQYTSSRYEGIALPQKVLDSHGSKKANSMGGYSTRILFDSKIFSILARSTPNKAMN